MPFSSSSFRFQEAPGGNNENPGPGAYFSPDDKVEIIIDGEREHKVSHYFKSNSKRSVFTNRGQRKLKI